MNFIKGCQADITYGYIPVLTGLNVEQLRSYDERCYHSAKPQSVVDTPFLVRQSCKGHNMMKIRHTAKCLGTAGLKASFVLRNAANTMPYVHL